MPQINAQQLFVANSTINGAGLDLFTTLHVDTDEPLCTYSGTHINSSMLPLPNESPRYDYTWSNNDLTIIIDAHNPTSCFGRYANDPISEHKTNAIIEARNGVVFLISTRPILANEEIFVSYGDGYWADRYHLFTIDTLRSPFQQELINSS